MAQTDGRWSSCLLNNELRIEGSAHVV
jgi:hypothetical protein